jgi:hypothetical protein
LGRVEWVKAHKNTIPILEILGARYSQAGAENASPVSTMANRLTVKSKIQPILVRGDITWSSAEKSLKAFEHSTGVYLDTILPEQTFKSVRKVDQFYVCSSKTPEIIGGWAALERVPTNWKDFRRGEQQVAICLLVSTRKNFGDQVGPDIFKIGQDVLEVIFIDPVEVGVFQRVGMGMIFSKDIIREFRDVDFDEYCLE